MYLFKQESVSFPTTFSHVKTKIQYVLIEHESSQNTLAMDCTGKGRRSTEVLYLQALYEAHPISCPLISVPQFEAAGRLDR